MKRRNEIVPETQNGTRNSYENKKQRKYFLLRSRPKFRNMLVDCIKSRNRFLEI